jgi:arsenite transporter
MLERRQLPLYLAGLAAGAAVGLLWPRGGLEALLWPALAVLLYATFTQVDLLRVGGALRERRFLGALLLANFVAVALLVWLLTLPVSGDQALMVGMLLVLLAPCIDWFVPFARAGGADTVRALTATPLLLIGQMAALPVYLLQFLGRDATEVLRAAPFVEAFAG